MGLPRLLDIQVLAADPSLVLLSMATVSCAVMALLVAVVVNEITRGAVIVARVGAGDASGLRATMHWLLLLVCTIIYD